MKPVSVIIPTFNRANFIGSALVSVLNQKDFLGEIIIMDDGSTDETFQKIEPYLQDHTIQYYCIDNSGPSTARNQGVEKAKHSLVAFLDSDDSWAKNKLHRQISHMIENPEYKISHTGEKWFRKGVHLNKKKIHFPRQGDIFDHCLQICAVGMSTVIMEKSLFEYHGGFDQSLPCCEDYDLWLRISSTNDFLLLNDELTIKNGGRIDQLSVQYRLGMDKYRIYSIEKLLTQHILSEEKHALAISELTKKCMVYGNGCIKHGNKEEGEYYLSIPQKYE